VCVCGGGGETHVHHARTNVNVARLHNGGDSIDGVLRGDVPVVVVQAAGQHLENDTGAEAQSMSFKGVKVKGVCACLGQPLDHRNAPGCTTGSPSPCQSTRCWESAASSARHARRRGTSLHAARYHANSSRGSVQRLARAATALACTQMVHSHPCLGVPGVVHWDEVIVRDDVGHRVGVLHHAERGCIRQQCRGGGETAQTHSA
jgi:hypothetical protein